MKPIFSVLMVLGVIHGIEILLPVQAVLDIPSHDASNNSDSTNTTFQVCNNTAEIQRFSRATPIKKKFEGRSFYRDNKCTEILEMTTFPPKMYLSNNGFIYTVMDAYSGHHNLVIRPDDVWAAIMTQFSFYVNKYAEKFRGKFVNFEGKKELTVTVGGSLRNASYDTLVNLMSQEIHKNLVDLQVKNWILPNFSTTTDNDRVTIGVVFMATMKKYFDYTFSTWCGIPQITLEGTIDDWNNIHVRLEKLKEFELENWYEMLEPVLKQFVNAKQGNVDQDFWQKIVHRGVRPSGSPIMSGWITVFAAFDAEGNFRKTDYNSNLHPLERIEDFPEVEIRWLRMNTRDIPQGVVEVEVKITDRYGEYGSMMIAGHVGTEIKPDNYTVQPTLGWAIALKA